MHIGVEIGNGYWFVGGKLWDCVSPASGPVEERIPVRLFGRDIATLVFWGELHYDEDNDYPAGLPATQVVSWSGHELEVAAEYENYRQIVLEALYESGLLGRPRPRNW